MTKQKLIILTLMAILISLATAAFSYAITIEEPDAEYANSPTLDLQVVSQTSFESLINITTTKLSDNEWEVTYSLPPEIVKNITDCSKTAVTAEKDACYTAVKEKYLSKEMPLADFKLSAENLDRYMVNTEQDLWITAAEIDLTKQGKFQVMIFDFDPFNIYKYVGQKILIGYGTATLEVIESDNDVGLYPTIAIDKNGISHILHYDNTVKNVRYCNNTGATWSCAAIFSPGSSALGPMQLAIGPDNQIHAVVVYQTTLFYLNKTAEGKWSNNSISTGNTDAATIEIDKRNIPHVFFADTTNTNTYYLNRTNNVWNQKQVYSSGGAMISSQITDYNQIFILTRHSLSGTLIYGRMNLSNSNTLDILSSADFSTNTNWQSSSIGVTSENTSYSLYQDTSFLQAVRINTTTPNVSKAESRTDTSASVGFFGVKIANNDRVLAIMPNSTVNTTSTNHSLCEKVGPAWNCNVFDNLRTNIDELRISSNFFAVKQGFLANSTKYSRFVHVVYYQGTSLKYAEIDYNTPKNPPTIDSLNILNSDNLNRTNGSLSFSWTFSDVDTSFEDKLERNETRWWNNGVLQTNLFNITNVSSTHLSAGEEWTLQLSTYDGYNQSIPRNATISLQGLTNKTGILLNCSNEYCTGYEAMGISTDNATTWLNLSFGLFNRTQPINCSLSFNNTAVFLNMANLEAYTNHSINSSFGEGDYIWTVNCSDYDGITSSVTSTFNITITRPYWLELPGNTYYNFNIDPFGAQWRGTDTTSNFSMGVNDTRFYMQDMMIDGYWGLDSYSYYPIPNLTYNLNISIHDNSGNINYTVWNFTVNKYQPYRMDYDITSSQGWTFTYGSPTTLTLYDYLSYDTEVIYTLIINNTYKASFNGSNGSSVGYNIGTAGTYNVSFNSTGSMNYTPFIWGGDILQIDKAIPSITQGGSGSWTWGQIPDVDYTPTYCSHSNNGDADVTYNLYRTIGTNTTWTNTSTNSFDGTWDNENLSTGVYHFVCNTTGGENYTSATANWDVTISKATITAGFPDFYVDVTPSSIYYSELVTATGYNCPNEMGCNLSRDGINDTNPHSNLNLSSDISGSKIYYFKYTMLESQNYTYQSTTSQLFVYQGETFSLNYYATPNPAIYYETYSNFSCEKVNRGGKTGGLQLYINSVNKTNQMDIDILRGVGDYEFECRYSGNQNFSAYTSYYYDNVYDSDQYYEILQVTPTGMNITLSANPIKEGWNITITGSECPSQLNCILQMNGTKINESIYSYYPSQGTFYFNYTNVSGNQNYTGYNVSKVLTVIAPDDAVAPNLNFTYPTPANERELYIGINNTPTINISSGDNTGEHEIIFDLNKTLVGWWRFEDIASAIDNSTYANAGTVYNVDNSSGKYGNGYYFDATTADYIDFGTPSQYDFGNSGAFTVSVWVKLETYSNYAGIVGKVVSDRSGSSYTWMMVTNPNNADKMGAYSTASNWVESNTANFELNKWTLLTYVYDGTNLYYYKDGASLGSSAFTYTDDTSHNLFAGSWLNGNYPFNGIMDDVQVYRRALSPREVQSLYNAQSTQYTNTTNTLPAGTYTLKGYAQDRRGNVNQTETRTITVPIPRITIEIDSSMTNPYFVVQNSTFNVTANITCKLTNCGLINVTLDPKTGCDPANSVCTATCGDIFINSATTWVVSGSNCVAQDQSNMITVGSDATCDGYSVSGDGGDCAIDEWYAPTCFCPSYQRKGGVVVAADCGGWCAIFDAPGNYIDLTDQFFTTGEGGGKGAVNMTTGAKPFYTLNKNPTNTTLNIGESAKFSWLVNATGNASVNYTFFVDARFANDAETNNQSRSWNVTIEESPPDQRKNITACGTISTSGLYKLNTTAIGINATTTCLTIAAHNVSIDCEGKRITYGTSTSVVGYGITTTGYHNLTVQNCDIYQGAARASGHAIYLNTGSKYADIQTNSIRTKGSSAYGVALNTNSNNATIRENIINTTGSGSYDLYYVDTALSKVTNNLLNATRAMPIYISETSNTTRLNHTIATSNTEQGKPINYYFNEQTTTHDAEDAAQIILANSNNVTISNSNLNVSGILIEYSQNTTIVGNRIDIHKHDNLGIYIIGTSIMSNVTGNFINMTGTTSRGIITSTLPQDTQIIGNEIIANSSSGINVYGQSVRMMIKLNNMTSRQSAVIYGTFSLSNVTGNRITALHATSGWGIYFSSTAGTNNLIYNNLFNMTKASTPIYQSSNTTVNKYNTSLNLTVQNILGYNAVQGNAYVRITNNGFSQTCADNNANLICDKYYNITTALNDFGPLATQDTLPPYVLITSPKNNTYVNGEVTIAATATDNAVVSNVSMFYRYSTDSTWVFICNATTVPYTCLWDTSALTDLGSGFLVNATAIDGSNNRNFSVMRYNLDKSLPTIKDVVVEYPEGQTSVRAGDSITLWVNTTDSAVVSAGMDFVSANLTTVNGTDIVNMTLAGGTLLSGQYSWWNLSVMVNNAYGVLTPNVIAYDNATPTKNIAMADSWSIQVDNESSTYTTMYHDPALPYNNTDVTFYLTVSDNFLTKRFNFSHNIGGSWINVSGEIATNPATISKVVHAYNGSYAYKWYIYDDAGNQNVTSEGLLEVMDNEPGFAIYLTEPTDLYSTYNTTNNFTFWYENGEALNCSLYEDDNWYGNISFPTINTAYNISMDLAIGSHSWNVRCIENQTLIEYQATARTIIILSAGLCTGTSDCTIDCTLNPTVTEVLDVGGYNLWINGAGTMTISSKIVRAPKINIVGGCVPNCVGGSCFS